LLIDVCKKQTKPMIKINTFELGKDDTSTSRPKENVVALASFTNAQTCDLFSINASTKILIVNLVMFGFAFNFFRQRHKTHEDMQIPSNKQ
jgi:hypothetical protein